MSNWPRLFYKLIKSRSYLRKPRSDTQNYVNKRLRYMINYAYTSVPFYNKLFKDSNVDPSEIKGVEDLGKIPIIDKYKLKDNSLNEILSTQFIHTKLNVIKTGGSTGEPFSTYVTDVEKEGRLAIQMRAYLEAGQKFYQRWASLDNFDTYETHRVSTFLFPQIKVPLLWNMDSKVNVMKGFDPEVVDGLSSAIWSLARHVNEGGIKGIHPKLVFGTGELVSPSFREELKKAFDASYFDQLSCTEVGRTAWECGENIGYHINSDSTIMQFVDNRGEEVSPGERGEIIYTSLHNFAMPIIRYSIQDVGIPIADECTCGVKLPLMKVMEGRHNSFIVFPNGLVVSPWKFIEAIKLYVLSDKVRRYKIIQERKDLIEIQIVKTGDLVDEEMIRTWVLNNLKTEFHEDTASLSDIEFRIVFVESIPTAGGKLNVVTSKLTNIPIL
jgi:phenylacetate-CoA ligase